MNQKWSHYFRSICQSETWNVLFAHATPCHLVYVRGAILPFGDLYNVSEHCRHGMEWNDRERKSENFIFIWHWDRWMHLDDATVEQPLWMPSEPETVTRSRNENDKINIHFWKRKHNFVVVCANGERLQTPPKQILKTFSTSICALSPVVTHVCTNSVTLCSLHNGNDCLQLPCAHIYTYMNEQLQIVRNCNRFRRLLAFRLGYDAMKWNWFDVKRKRKWCNT